MKTQVTKKFVPTLVDVFEQFSIKAVITTELANSAAIGTYVYVQLPYDSDFNLIFDVTQFLKAFCTMLGYYMERGLVVKEGYKKNQLCIF